MNLTFFTDLKFSKDGHFSSSPYCVVLQATEKINRNIHKENATICIFTAQPISTLHGIELLPKPEEYRDERGGRKKRIKNGNTENSFDPPFPSNINVIFPDNATIFQNATNFARVTAPQFVITDKLNFRIDSDVTGIFDITKSDGIIFVQNSYKLRKFPPAIYTIEVGWRKEKVSKRISIEIIRSDTFCNLTSVDDFMEEFCSKHQFKEDCENSCGFGSRTGKCQWREYKATSNKTDLSAIYSTCSPHNESCGNQFCDGLESSKKHFVCPQDCTKEVHGTLVREGDKGIKSAHQGAVCTCDENIACSCGTARNIPVTTSATVDYHTTGADPNITHKSTNECGAACIGTFVSVGLIFMFTVTFLLKFHRDTVRKEKKLKEELSTVVYRGDSTDTEIIHINIHNEVDKENYEKAYQKFDFDAKWEFDRTKLILDSVLGEGEFGKVVKGYATDLNKSGKESVTTVAVKTIKTKNNSVELLSLLSEFQLLQEVSHPNVVTLLGACIRGDQPLIIIEYCCYGSLRNYLRMSRKLEESAGDIKIDGVEPVTAKDVLSFAWQTCKGMAYLAEMKLVHRDLAARNVLLAEGKICKVSDFGLTRDVYEDDAYLKKSKDRVPVNSFLQFHSSLALREM